MLDTSPLNMWQELEASRMASERIFESWDTMIARYAGPHYSSATAKGRTETENPGFELVATLIGQLVAGDPQCTAKCLRTDRPQGRLKAIAYKHALNRLARESKLKRLTRKLIVDFLFRRSSVVLSSRRVMSAARGPLTAPPWRPIATRIPPKRLRYDARAIDWEERVWTGHESLMSKSKLLDASKHERGWRVKEIDALQTETFPKGQIPKDGQSVRGRDDFPMYQVHVPDEQLAPRYSDERGFHGTLHWYAYNGGSPTNLQDQGSSSPLVEIRDPQPAFGPRGGPYLMSGQFYVPDQVEPLAVMVAIEHISRSLCMRSAVIDQAMRDYKKFVLEGTGAKNLGRILKNARHGGVVKAKGFDRSKAAEFTTGGIDQVLMAMYQHDQARMRQLSGLTEAMRGNPQAGTTATAEALAQGGASARVADVRDVFHDHISDVFEGFAEIIHYDDRFYLPLSEEAQQEMGVRAVGLRGGPDPDDANGSFEDTEIVINPLSMKYVDQAELQASADRELAMWGQVAPQIIQAPFLDWKSILQDRADSFGNDALSSRVNWKMAEQIASLVLHQSLMGQAFAPGDVQPQPQSALDSGFGRPRQATATVIGTRGSQPAKKQLPAPQRSGLPGDSAGQFAANSIGKTAKPAAVAKPARKSASRANPY